MIATIITGKVPNQLTKREKVSFGMKGEMTGVRCNTAQNARALACGGFSGNFLPSNNIYNSTG